MATRLFQKKEPESISDLLGKPVYTPEQVLAVLESYARYQIPVSKTKLDTIALTYDFTPEQYDKLTQLYNQIPEPEKRTKEQRAKDSSRLLKAIQADDIEKDDIKRAVSA